MKDTVPTLAESGISKKESMYAQSLVVLHEKNPEDFERVRNGQLSIAKTGASEEQE